jgi:SAM-dependent methyltransferase
MKSSVGCEEIPVVANAAQIKNWDGPAGRRWVADADRYEGMVKGFGARIARLAQPAPGMRLLDVGCGNGTLALTLGAQPGVGASVTGLDISGPMLDNARRWARELGLGSVVTFEQGDAQVHPLRQAHFDLAVSRFGVMFFDDPVAAFGNIGRALKPGGRFVFACWGDRRRNTWVSLPAQALSAHVPPPSRGQPGDPGPFSLADADRLRQVLREADFAEIALQEVVEQVTLGRSVEDTLAFIRRSEIGEGLMSGARLAGTGPDATERGWDAVREALQAHARDGEVVFTGTAWLVTARRRPDGYPTQSDPYLTAATEPAP